MQDACLKPSTLQEIKQHTAKDDSLQEIIKVIKAGWPETKRELPHLVLPYFGIRDELSVDNDVLVRRERLVIPKSLGRDLSVAFIMRILMLSAACREQENEFTGWA